MKRVIITGADGFIGSYTVKFCLTQGIEVLAVDVHEKPRRLNEKVGLTYLPRNVENIDKFENSVQYDYYDTFIHLAWIGSSGHQRTDYQLQMKNAMNTVECMKMAKRIGCKRFVCAGSIMEYEVEATVHTQGSHPSMGYIYGMGKHIAHCLCKSIANDIGIDLLWPMITNAYGIGEFSPRFVNSTLRKIISGEPLQFTAATQNYDFVYVTDVAKAVYLIAQKGKPFYEYLIGSGNARPLKEFIIEMYQEFASGITPIFGDVPFTGTNLPLSVFDISALINDCGFSAEVSFIEGTRKTMEWLKTVKGE